METTNIHRARLSLERLETRANPSITLTPQGVIHIIGGFGDDTAVVENFRLNVFDDSAGGGGFIDFYRVTESLDGVFSQRNFRVSEVTSGLVAWEGGEGDDRFHNLTGLDHQDRGLLCAEADGGAGDDTLLGGILADRLFGSQGSDRLFGMEGNDVLVGGVDDGGIFFGADRLEGGPGADIFWRDPVLVPLPGGPLGDLTTPLAYELVPINNDEPVDFNAAEGDTLFPPRNPLLERLDVLSGITQLVVP